MDGLDRIVVEGFEMYSRQVYVWAFRVLGRHHDAMDVVQDVFVRWNDQCKADPPACPMGWLRRVTINRALDGFRSRTHREGAGQAIGFMLGANTPRPEALMEQQQLRSDISLALEELTEAQRNVVVAKVYDGHTFAQIAADCGLSVSTVKTHYLRAIRSLRDRLTKWVND